MEQLLILLVTLAGVTHAFFPAADSKCNASTQNKSVCSVTLGGSVFIQVMSNASGLQVRCKKQRPAGDVPVFPLNTKQVTIKEDFRNKIEFFIKNGTLKITNVERNDSGQYIVDAYDPNGIHVRNVIINLDVQESVLPIFIIICSAVGALLIVVVISFCAFCKVRRHKKARQSKAQCEFGL